MKRMLISLAVSAAISGSTQAAENNNSNSVEEVERIVVTGSRIKGVDLEGAQPLTVLNQDDIKRSGANTISELLSDLAQTRGGDGSFSTSESGGTSTSTPAGQAAASLRGLGPSSTLTLINGRRVAPSSFASGTENFVDINSIPLAAIDRIEILATGASAIYGADAVAGVINYILKDDFEGAEVDVSFQDSTASTDESSKNINLIFGTQVADGNLTVFANYFDRNGFSATDRSFTKDPKLESYYSYLPKLENAPNIYYYSSRDGNELASPNCKTELVETEYGEQICAYYGNDDDLLETPFESISSGFTFNKQISNLDWHTDFFFSKTKSMAQSSPAAINQLDDSEGVWVTEDALFDAFGDGADLAFSYDDLYFDPFYTQADRKLYGIQVDARFNDPRTVEVESESFRLVSSLQGEIGEWEWESGITLSRSTSEQVATKGIYNRYKFHGSLAGELCSDGSLASADSGELSCNTGDLLNAYNPFISGDEANDSILAATQEKPTRSGESTVYGWDARINGELFEFGDDYVRAAMGVEYRKEELTDIPSLNSQANRDNDYLVDVFGYGSSISEADRTQYGAFAEFYVPVSDEIELQLAGRYDHFDDFGSTFNPKIGVTFRPTDSLVIRGSWATSFRAPSLTQAGVKLRTTTSTYDCGANQAVSDFYCDGETNEVSPNTIEVGNPSLNAEESDSISVGFAFSPSENTNLTVDYWQFEHEDIVDTNMTGIMAQSLSDASLRHCGVVADGETGISFKADLCEIESLYDSNGLNISQEGANLDQILANWNDYNNPEGLPANEVRNVSSLYRDHVIPLENTGTQKVAGIDIKFDHRFIFNQGDIKFAFDATHYLTFDRNKPGSDEIESLVGTWRYPENIISAKLSWSADDYYIGLKGQYIDSYLDDIEGLRDRQKDELASLNVLNNNGDHVIDSWTVFDLYAGYDFKDMSIGLSINNILDEEPPVAYASQRGFDSINHDADGRTYRVSFTYAF